jgi:mRNA interferase MazF
MGNNATGAERVRRRRDKLRAAGLRPVQIWVPDTSAPGFAEECRRQWRPTSSILISTHGWMPTTVRWRMISTGVTRGDIVTVALQGDHGKPRPVLIVQSDR